jgi:heme/copper-type cytochrome/quinol oxidase subunit 2
MQNFLNRNSLLSLISAPVIWGLHFLAAYLTVSLACAAAYTQPLLWGVDIVGWGVALLTLIALALLLYIAVINHAKWRRSADREAPGTEINRFFSLCSVLLCVLSAVAVIWVAFPAFILPSCAT